VLKVLSSGAALKSPIRDLLLYSLILKARMAKKEMAGWKRAP
jgi:hypothetical protein